MRVKKAGDARWRDVDVVAACVALDGIWMELRIHQREMVGGNGVSANGTAPAIMIMVDLR